MKAVGYQKSLPVTDAKSLIDVELPKQAVSVNPVDTKMRMRAEPPAGEWRVLGWDAAGIVETAGPEAKLFKAGDAVFYAGTLNRQGTNSEYHLVDERIVGPKPASLSNAEAAALPLTAITAWETLFDRLDVKKAVPGAANAILIIGGAGGVGSIAIQLARALTDLTVIATASRLETAAWVKQLGAHHVVDHGKQLAAEVARLGIGAPAFVFSTTQTDRHFDQIVEAIAPQGRFGLIDDPDLIDIRKLKRKSASLHWEFMFTRSMFETADVLEQNRLLTEVARLVDAGKIKTTLGETYGKINADNLRRAHALIESGKAKGKIVLEGF
jgi:NADPH2:quinone reductase